MPRPLLVLLLCLGAALAGPGQTGLRKLWASTQYTPQPLPAVWTPATVAKGGLTVESLRAAGIKETGLSIPKFIARHGLPGRYLTTRKAGEWDFLI